MDSEKQSYRSLVILFSRKFGACVELSNGHHVYAYEKFIKDPTLEDSIIHFLGTRPLDHIFTEIKRSFFLDAFAFYRAETWG